jgi:hypothetical protein
MPTIIRAEYLSYYNPARNSDKLFNIFLIRDDDGTFRCITENGRRGSNPVRHTLCTKELRETAENALRQKLYDKRNHRDTPYREEPSGFNYSQVASEYSFDSQAGSFILPTENEIADKTPEPKSNVIAFPAQKTDIPAGKPKQNGILNSEQFDSLEL